MKHVNLSNISIFLAGLATISATMGVVTGNNRYLSASLVSGNLTGLIFQIKYSKQCKVK